MDIRLFQQRGHQRRFPYNLPAVAMATMETGVLQAAISAVSPVGMAHDGIDNIPKGTWLLDGGERVLNLSKIRI